MQSKLFLSLKQTRFQRLNLPVVWLLLLMSKVVLLLLFCSMLLSVAVVVEEDVDDGVVTPSPQVSKRRSKSWPMATQSKERQRILTKIIFVGSLVWE